MDPMTSPEQAEAEADERYFEERDDMDAGIAAAEAHQRRRKAQWREHCIGGHSSPSVCPCVEPCDSCGHLAAEHELTEGFRMGQTVAGHCDRDECDCAQFTRDE